MVLLSRKNMPSSGATLKIVIGIITLWFILGIFLIISGVREAKRVKTNNSLPKVVIEESNINGYVDIYAYDGNKYTLELTDIKYISLSNSDTLYYLFYFDKGIEKKICLGQVEDNKVREFNNSLNN